MSNLDVQLRPAWRNYWAGFAMVVLLLIAAGWSGLSGSEAQGDMIATLLLVLALITLGFVVIKRFSWKFSINENRISRQYGIIARNQQSVRINDLRSIELDQSVFQRIFGVGDLSFYSAGSDTAEVRFVGITQPAAWRDKINDAMDPLKDSSD